MLLDFINNLKRKYPNSFWLMCFTITWERFSYHGISTLLVLYFTASIVKGGIGLSPKEATSLYGLYVGILHFTPLIGGWLSDRYLGQQRSIILGGIFISLGNFFLFTSSNIYQLYFSLLFIIIGNGFFKANGTNLVGNIYSDKSTLEREIAYSLFYMFINLGSFLAPFTAGLVADKFFAIKSISGEIIHYGYKPMFFICSIIGITWTITFLCLAPKYLKDTGKSPYHLYKAEQKSIFSFDFTDNEKKRIKAMGIISIFVILFWTSFYQSFSSITLYARDHVDRNLLGFIIPVPWFAALNAILGILFAPILALVWNQLRKRNVTIPVKISLGIFSMGTAFAFMTISVLTSGDMKANMIFIVFAYVFNTISELCIAPIGIAMFNCLSPKRYSTFFMGLWYMTMFIASIISGKVAGFTQDMGFLTIFFSLSVILFIMGSVLYLSRKTLDNLMVVEDDCDCRII